MSIAGAGVFGSGSSILGQSLGQLYVLRYTSVSAFKVGWTSVFVCLDFQCHNVVDWKCSDTKCSACWKIGSLCMWKYI